MGKTVKIVIGKGGEIRHLHDDRVTAALSKLGTSSLERASHVEPLNELLSIPGAQRWLWKHLQRTTGCGPDEANKKLAEMSRLEWWADLRPVGGPILGPYAGRDAALSAEKEWLESHGVPSQVKVGDPPRSYE